MTRARMADADGFVERGGVKIHYEVYGDGGPTILLLPAWTIIHKRFWKLQVPYLSRHHRVVTYDGPGNGLSDRPLDPAAYHHDRQVEYAVDVLDVTGTDAAVVVGLSRGALWALQLAAEHADRVQGTVAIGSSLPLTDPHPFRVATGATQPVLLPESRVPLVARDPIDHWAKYDDAFWDRAARGLPVVLLRDVLPRATVDQADRGLRRLGAGHRSGRAHRRAVGHGPDEGDDRGLVWRDHVAGPGHPRRSRHDHAALPRSADRRAHRWRVRGHRGRRAHPAGPRPGEGQPPASTTSSPAWRPPRVRRPGPWTVAARRRCSTSRRRSDWVMRGATSRSPRR